MTLGTHLSFRGECAAAFDLYARIFGGEPPFVLTYGNSPMAAQVPAEWRDKVVHATLRVPGMELSGTDPLPDQYVGPQGFSLLASVDTIAEAERVFAALAEQGRVTMPLGPQFWTARFGMLVDRFGIPWEVTCAAV